jgi:hypothetical protein
MLAGSPITTYAVYAIAGNATFYLGLNLAGPGGWTSYVKANGTGGVFALDVLS